MSSPGIPCENIPQASTRTLAPFSRSAVRTVAASVTLVVGVALLTADEPERSGHSVASTSPVEVPGQAGPPVPAPNGCADPDAAAIVELQRHVNDLRSDLLDERERRIGRLQEANGALLVVLGLLVGVGGLWAYAKFRAIAREARMGAAAARALEAVEPNLTLRPSGLSAAPGLPPHPFPQLLRASVEGDVGPSRTSGGANGSPAEPWASNGHRAGHGPVDEPRPESGTALLHRPDRSTPDPKSGVDDAELQRYKEVIADCTEAIRLSPDESKLYLERGNAFSGMQFYEDAIADYDRAISLDPGNVAAYLGRCRAKSELGLHDEALEDYEHIVSLDPDLAGSPERE